MSWPAGFPIPMREGYSMSTTAEVLATQMEQGPERRRRITRADDNRFTISLYLTAAQVDQFWLEIWDGFANATTNYFDMPLLSRGALATHSARFEGSVRLEEFGRDFRLSCGVSTRSRVA